MRLALASATSVPLSPSRTGLSQAGLLSEFRKAKRIHRDSGMGCARVSKGIRTQDAARAVVGR